MEEGSENKVEGSTGRTSARNRDLTKGSIIGNLWSLSWPMMISSILNMAGPTIDMVWVGRLGAASIAGVGVAGLVVQVVIAAMMGIVTGARAIIARFIGAGDAKGANHVAQQAFVISAVFSIVFAVIGFLLVEQIMLMFGLEPDVIAEGAAYMRIMFVGAAAMSFRTMAEGMMQASGDAVTPMKIIVFSRIFHVVFVPFLIFGWWIFPRMGVSGAALTNVISQSLGLALGLWFLFGGRTRLRVTLSNFRVDLNIIWRMVKIGIPIAILVGQWMLGGLVMMWFMAPFGTLAVAAHTLVERVSAFVQMPSSGFGAAAGVLAGQNLGAGQPERAARSGWMAVGLVGGLTLIGSVYILLWPESLVRIFSSEPDLVEITGIFLKIAILAYLGMGLCSVFFMWLSGVGDTIPPLVIGLGAMWLVQMPLAYLLPKYTDLGVYGVRWAIVASLVVGALIYMVYMPGGRWKSKKV